MDEVAYHEAGHALMAVSLGGTVESVTIEPDWDDGPQRSGDARVVWPSPFDSHQIQLNSILVALAGPVAEMIYRQEPYHPGFVAEWASDWSTAWSLAAAIVSEDRPRLAYLERLCVRLHRLLGRDDYWAALAAIADHLSAHDRLEGEEVEEIVRVWIH